MLKEENIRYIGIKQLKEEEKTRINELSSEYYPKIKRLVRNITSLIIHVKEYEKEGTKIKYSLHVRLIMPGKTIESCKSHDWNLAKALHKSFNGLITEIQHTFHTERGWKKKYE